jgi:hypothetical protein
MKNSSKFVWRLKVKKKRFGRFFLTHDHRGFILFLPYLSRTHAPPPITGGGGIVDLRQVACPSVLQSPASVRRQYRPIFGGNLPIFDLILSVRGSVHRFKFDLLLYLCNPVH